MKFKAFCLRLMDVALSESDWLESIGSHLALKPPSKWHDAEEDLFNYGTCPCRRTFSSVSKAWSSPERTAPGINPPFAWP